MQLSYRRNEAVRALATRRTQTIGVIVTGTTNYGSTQTLFAIEDAARKRGFYLNFVSVDDLNQTSMRAAVDHLIRGGAEGLLAVAPTRAASEAVAGQYIDRPLVVLGAPAGTTHGYNAHQRAGARLATEHLLALGHDTVLHIRGPQGWFEADERERGWLETIANHGAVAAPPLVGDWSASSGYELGRRLAQTASVPTAVFVANDHMALGLMSALSGSGYSVPKDVSIVGYDNVPEAAYLSVPLTTVSQDYTALGATAVAALFRLLGVGEMHQQSVPTPTLIVRQSTRAA